MRRFYSWFFPTDVIQWSFQKLIWYYLSRSLVAAVVTVALAAFFGLLEFPEVR